MRTEDLHKLFLNASGVCTDSRNIEHNAIFFALKGDNFNGNAFALEALKLGASYAVVDENVDHSNVRLIKVNNVLKTLQELATFHRKFLGLPILALTGSNGKTTTKELIKAVLSKKYHTAATRGNFNNHIGVPLTLLSFNKNTQIGIVEMGANHQKEIEALCNIALPDYGLITNYGKAHLEGFGGVEGVIKGKSEMYDHLISHHKTIFYNSCDDIQKSKLSEYQKKFAFGNCTPTDFHTELLKDGYFVKFKTKDGVISSKLTGDYNYNNLALAAAIGHYFEVTPEDIRSALESYVPSNNRSQLISKNGKEILLDAYNANPSSMEAALRHFANHAPSEKRSVILGDMFELGEEAADLHQYIADLCEQLGLENIYLVGKHFSSTQTKAKTFENFEKFSAYIKSEPLQTPHLLIKGSRGMALERVLELI
ncbi:UDP-N-acetylmuramoyl-tripeptide--D-alanyl-D-alanine ligase [Robertkochia marina]|uniref:UDP-N-acetylmuramoyl-tripeptide--D-alanyl-D-alanine ligase n=1 Tax=Robertkochia marina TaxID=1227945 RepID=A0A4V3UYJ4_9FLAO|nr:UDP-N-acetylmuramoyl-tripeptide--D-alanyl-D-alanine ligase [Robertkochia marina]THD69878.1 UDP-N-acetylmuramoyl-tripeptide--D-alanyl-D-alanine ligase [Robertkochia marina]TRZ46775.1 UDP-N-acetylmuramoyl-tripeptide--D-alanyl-D-alanine ligase [Robertkochia marina]